MNRSAIAGALVVSLALSAPSEARAERPGVDASHWWDEVAKADRMLRAGRWRAGKSAAKALAAKVVRQSWYGAELRKVLAELAFLRAAAAANLGKRDEALWYWQMAQNIDFRIRRKDPAPYGEAGKLLREFPLRKRGEAPAGFRIVRPAYGKKFHYAVPTKRWAPTIPLNAGARIEGVGDIKIELVIDRFGVPHHPVIVSTYSHPVVMYGALDELRTMPLFKPARDSGEPVDSLFEFTASFRFERWDQGGPISGPRID